MSRQKNRFLRSDECMLSRIEIWMTKRLPYDSLVEMNLCFLAFKFTCVSSHHTAESVTRNLTRFIWNEYYRFLSREKIRFLAFDMTPISSTAESVCGRVCTVPTRSPQIMARPSVVECIACDACSSMQHSHRMSHGQWARNTTTHLLHFVHQHLGWWWLVAGSLWVVSHAYHYHGRYRR